jgi:DNA-directed RNA polymerase subunit H
MLKYVPGEVYTNIQALCGYRNITTDHNFLPISDFSKHLNQFGYIKITGTRRNLPAFIIMIGPDSKYATKSPDFKKLFSVIPENTLAKSCEILFISEQPLTPHIKKELLAVRKRYPSAYIEDYDYSRFLIEIPKHAAVPHHEIATPQEVEEFCETNYLKKEDLPKMLVSDAAAVWYGPRPGDVMKIHRPSETAGHSIGYRLVIKG